MSQNFGPYKTIKLDRIKDLLILHFWDTEWIWKAARVQQK